MTSSKRKLNTDTRISPPPLRRKVQSTTTKTAVASFFTPTSRKAPEKIIWTERAPDDDTDATLLVGRYQPANEGEAMKSAEKERRRKVAAFDFDSTLVETASGKKFATDGGDWKWWHASVPGKLRKLYFEDGFRIVVITNQGGLSLKADPKIAKANQSKIDSFKSRVSAVLNQLDLPISIYAATAKDMYRKPRTGIWKELIEDYGIQLPGDLNLEDSVFVGDAGGIQFHTPEEYFLDEPPRPFTRTLDPLSLIKDATAAEVSEKFIKKNDRDIILFVGSPGAGKSSFYWRQLQPLGYERINQDTLKSRDKCLKVAGKLLEEGKSVAIDNTNADIETRSKWIALAKGHSTQIRCVLFTANAQICEHNDVVRALNSTMNPEKRTMLPRMAFTGFASRYQRPQLSEGFQDITEVAFKVRPPCKRKNRKTYGIQCSSMELKRNNKFGLDIGLEPESRRMTCMTYLLRCAFTQFADIWIPTTQLSFEDLRR
ncbi:hypothetical protein B7494_g6595 [Chlorociboria aeruginascens]|nr:hypothetical protein B7494_g6595 [Chlorociboria aeruginascens]